MTKIKIIKCNNSGCFIFISLSKEFPLPPIIGFSILPFHLSPYDLSSRSVQSYTCLCNNFLLLNFLPPVKFCTCIFEPSCKYCKTCIKLSRWKSRMFHESHKGLFAEGQLFRETAYNSKAYNKQHK